MVLFCQVRCDKTVRRAPFFNLEKSPAESFVKNTSGGSRGVKFLPADSSDDEANVPSLLAPVSSSKATSSSKKKAPAARSEEKGAASENPPPHKPEKWACKACTLINPGRSHLSHNPASALVNLRPHPLIASALLPPALQSRPPAYALALTPMLVLTTSSPLAPPHIALTFVLTLAFALALALLPSYLLSPSSHRPHHRSGTARKCKACEKPNPSRPSKKKLKEAREAKADAKAQKLKADAAKAEAKVARPGAPASKLPIDVRQDRPAPPLTLGVTTSTRHGKKRSYDAVEGDCPPSPSLPPSRATSPNGAVRCWPTSPPSPHPGLQCSSDPSTYYGCADPDASRVHLRLRGADPGIYRWANAEVGATDGPIHQWPDPRPNPGLYQAAEDVRCLICLGDLDADAYIEPRDESGPARPNASFR